MSEQNILNPNVSSLLCPDFPLERDKGQRISRWQAKSGRPYGKNVQTRGRMFQLQWGKRPYTTYQALDQWDDQYEQDFFTLYDITRGRYYSGQFDGPVVCKEVGNQAFDITANFVEIPGLPMYQYPSNWGLESKFYEERDGFGDDLVKLTGTWDRRDRNYCLYSRDCTNAAWSKNTGVSVTADVIAGPNDAPGATTADRIDYNGSGVAGDFRIYQNPTLPGSNTPPVGVQTTVSVWLRTVTGTLTLRVANNAGFQRLTFNLTTAWQKCPVPASGDGASISQILIYSDAANNAAFSIYATDAQIEYGGAATANALTTSATAQLSAPNTDANLHGGFAYWNLGTTTTDAAEWLYFGYGFRLWAPKNPYMGIVQVLLDGVSQGTIDLYAAAATASAPLLTVQNVALGEHRITLNPTNTKNASSSGFWVCADALEVMR